MTPQPGVGFRNGKPFIFGPDGKPVDIDKTHPAFLAWQADQEHALKEFFAWKPTAPVPPQRPPAPACRIADCEGKYHARGLCQRHYRAQRRAQN